MGSLEYEYKQLQKDYEALESRGVDARLAAAYEDLKQATDAYNETRADYRQAQRQERPAGDLKAAFDVAMFRHEAGSKAFNQEVSATIKGTGVVPLLAEAMLDIQRWNGFHAKGLAKIISNHRRLMVTEDETTDVTVGGIDALILPAITDLKEAWYGMEIDKKKYRIALEDETEDTVYLKIVKKPLTTGEK
jgi:hypothetical protein